MPVTRKRKARFSNRTELLDFLLEVSSTASSTLELNELLERIGQIVHNIIPFELFAILLYSEREKALRIRYAIGHRDEIVRNLRIPLDEGITGIAASARMPICVGDVTADPRYLPVVDAVHSELAVPMLARGRLVGVIDIQSTKRDAYDEEDSALVQLIGSRVAASIMNARLFRRIERQNRTLRTLGRVAQEFSSLLDLDELFHKVAETVRELIHYDAFSILLVDEERELLRSRFSLRYDQRVDLDNIPLGQGITGTAAEKREIIRVENTHRDPRYIESTSGIHSEIAVPLIRPGGLVGVMDLESERVNFFTEEHAQTLSLLSPLIAGAIANGRLVEELQTRKQRMEADLHAAHQLQSLLLPAEPPRIPGLDIAARFRPAHEISGDVYDFFEYGDRGVIAIGDASGKSVAAALYAAMVSGLLRTLAPRRRSPAALMQSLNEVLLTRRTAARYSTMLVLYWEPGSGALTMSNAGSVPPVICRGEELIYPHVEGVPLGLLEDQSYDEVRFQTQPGDLIVLYSDGIQDQHNPDRHDYGTYRLPALIRSMDALGAGEVVERLFADFDEFRAGHQIFDDQTVVVLRVLERS
jgi:phosphoserine phosphatase RsbU/P